MSNNEEKWTEKLLTDQNWFEWDSKFKDRVSGYNKDVGYLLAKGVCPPQIDETVLAGQRPSYSARRQPLNPDGSQLKVRELDEDGHVVTENGAVKMRLADPVFVFEQNEEGKSIHQGLVKKWDIRVSKYEDAKVKMMGLIFSSVSATIMEDMKVNDMYQDYRTDGNFYAMYLLARAASTGQGEHSMFLDICKIMDLKIINDNHNAYFTDYKACEYKIMNSDKDAGAILQGMLTSLFYRGLRGSKKLKRLVEDEMTKPIPTPVSASIKTFNTYLTARKNMGMDGDSKEGMISANEAAVTRGDMKRILRARDQVAKDNLEAYAAYRAGGGTDSPKKWLCYNCGEIIDHGWKNCPKPREICSVCQKYHITSVHKTLEDKKLYRTKAGSPRKKNFVKQAHLSSIDDRETEASQDADYLEYVMMYEDRDIRANAASLNCTEFEEFDVEDD